MNAWKEGKWYMYLIGFSIDAKTEYVFLLFKNAFVTSWSNFNLKEF